MEVSFTDSITVDAAYFNFKITRPRQVSLKFLDLELEKTKSRQPEEQVEEILSSADTAATERVNKTFIAEMSSEDESEEPLEIRTLRAHTAVTEPVKNKFIDEISSGDEMTLYFHAGAKAEEDYKTEESRNNDDFLYYVEPGFIKLAIKPCSPPREGTFMAILDPKCLNEFIFDVKMSLHTRELGLETIHLDIYCVENRDIIDSDSDSEVEDSIEPPLLEGE